jgi:hypothetical protein
MKIPKIKFKARKMKRPQNGVSMEEFETLRQQVMQLQKQVNAFSLSPTQPITYASIGYQKLGIILYYLFLPLRWVKNTVRMMIRLIRRAWIILKNPKSYWLGFYWLSFAWVVMLDGGLKDVFGTLRHPRSLARSIGLIQD